MRKIIVISIFVFACFVIENILSEMFGRWFAPNLIIILIVFFNLFRGTKYSLLTALIAGLLQDSFGAKLFGLNIFSFLVVAMITTLIKVYVYQVGSKSSRVFIVFFITIINIIIQYILNLLFYPIDFAEAFNYILIPEVLATTIIANYTFKKFRQCALKLSA